jgi:hypothetical protein
MTDIRADEPTPLDEDRLPWLEAIDEENERDGPSPAKLIAAVLVGLVAIGLIVGGLFWLSNRHRPAGNGEVIQAEAGDYKVPSNERGTMNVQGAGQTAAAAGAGAEPKAQINTNAVPEAPVVDHKGKPPQPAQQAAAAPAKQPAATPAPKAKPAPAPAPTASGATIQLGAFSSQGAAESAWKALSGRFGYLAGLSHSVTSTSAGGRTLYRLRASGGDAHGVCGRLQVAGESCAIVD